MVAFDLVLVQRRVNSNAVGTLWDQWYEPLSTIAPMVRVEDMPPMELRCRSTTIIQTFEWAGSVLLVIAEPSIPMQSNTSEPDITPTPTPDGPRGTHFGPEN